jgi:protein disulfide-isomerase
MALDGYCVVTLVEQEKWVRGDSQWGAIHRGHTYLFTGPEEQKRFLANFAKYAPALSGYDAVKYAESGQLVEGKRAHGVFYRGQIFLFADEPALQKFWANPEQFATLVRAEQQRPSR